MSYHGEECLLASATSISRLRPRSSLLSDGCLSTRFHVALLAIGLVILYNVFS